MTEQSKLIELAERIEALDGIIAAALGVSLMKKAFALIHPMPQVRVPRQANGEPWGGDGIGPYTSEYQAWSKTSEHFHRCLTAYAFLDASMTLVPEGACWKVEDHPAYGISATVECEQAFAATPTLALVAAALRAHAGESHD